MCWQCFALGLAAWLALASTDVRGGALGGVCGGALQGRELSLQAGLVGGQRLLEQAALLGVHGLGLGAELPGPQLRQLEGDLLYLGVSPLDGLRLRVNALALLAKLRQQLPGKCLELAWLERLEVLGLDCIHVEHAALSNARKSIEHAVLF